MDLLTIVRNKIKAELDARALAETQLREVTEAAEARGEDLNESETTTFTEARAAIQAADAAVAELTAREAELVADNEARDAAAAVAARLAGTTTPPAGPAPVVVRNAEAIYRPDGEHSVFVDAFRSLKGDRDAQDRLYRHAQIEAESRDVGTAAFGALVPPQYLVDMFAPNLAAGRAFSNTVRSAPLPATGMTLNIPRGTTATGVAVQASQGDAVTETDFDETTLAVSVLTYGGQNTVSRQALERGSGIDAIIFADLAEQYSVALNTANITATLATSGIGSVTYTDASPTVAEIFPKLANAIQTVNGARFMPASVIFMHPRRWGWFTAALDANSRPLISTDVPDNTIGLGKAAAYGQVVGQLLGVPVVTDACIGTTLGAGTEDAIIVAKADDILLFENSPAPQELRIEQSGTLQVMLAAYGFSAFTAGRYPAAICKITGTGLAAPTF